MRSVILFVLLAYFLSDTVITLVNHGWPFGATQWVLVALCAAYIVLGVIVGKRAYAALKATLNKRNGGGEDEAGE